MPDSDPRHHLTASHQDPSLVGIQLRLMPPDPEAFAPYGRFVTPPDRPGERAFYSDAFAEHPDDTSAVVHVNFVRQTPLPITASQVERHPYAAQCFLPLDVERYVVVVMPSNDNGDPDPSRACAFDMPGSIGVIYAPNVWHLGASVMERDGHFAVMMWRGGAQADDEFRHIPPITLIDAP
ncbi:ureidoglycolate lyase [Flavimaricola marinus]|uniref:Ureidoglycolate lyase n=1 Tax=Flavimaricola marinus TaxID=1819565 RepID=A0A238L8V3_9RHOB|nr:ureidoglycolate lyase [Flavimaricola marinus]SMY06098.1 Ureidoglycolate lyase [Flavimaricola marinus]